MSTTLTALQWLQYYNSCVIERYKWYNPGIDTRTAAIDVNISIPAVLEPPKAQGHRENSWNVAGIKEVDRK